MGDTPPRNLYRSEASGRTTGACAQIGLSVTVGWPSETRVRTDEVGRLGDHHQVNDDVQMDVQQNRDAGLVELLVRRLVASNDRVAPPEEHERLAVFAWADEELVGGALGFTHWGWLFVSHLWVDESRRRCGLGSELMDEIERAAASRGAQAVHLDTYDFQALGFYEARGYRVFGQLDDYPPGHTRYFLTRSLGDDRQG
jgi:ribosomal protein S18 acetylase RimI-like enzyme